MPKVSVIIPNYNHASFLRQRIDSVLNQTFQDFEVIILDDCSTDDSINVIELYRIHPKVTHIIYNKKNSGSAFKQWVKGIEISQGKYIWIAESDDWAENNLLEALLYPLESNEALGIAYGNSNWVDDKNVLKKSLSIYQSTFQKNGKQEIIEKLLKYNTIQNASACLIRKEMALKSLSGIENFKACGDWYFYINVLKKSDLYYTAEILNNFRWYRDNTSNNSIKSGLNIKEGFKIVKSFNYREIKLSKEEKLSILKFWNQSLSKVYKRPYRFLSLTLLFLSLYKFNYGQ
jgi:glycosyltransferase involved in cell wall biosynthesis